MKLKDKYKKEVAKKLKEEFGLKNEMEIPKLTKAVVNVGFGRFAKEKAFTDNIVSALTRITGQKPVLTKAKKSISSFKVREGMVIGAAVTLRGQRMWDFVDKLINVSLPRIRDFRGINDKSIDRLGNLTIGFKEHVSFPEIKVDEVDNVFGLEVCLATTAKNKAQGLALFTNLGFPIKKS